MAKPPTRTQYIVAQAKARGIDPQAALAVASVEGLSGGIGDGGHAFGPWQLNNAGGVITGQFKGWSPDRINKWAWSNQGINNALDRIAKVATGLKGQTAINAIVRRFERPAAPDQEVARANAAYGNSPAANAPAGPIGASASPAQSLSPVLGAGAVPGISDKQSLLLSLLNNGGSDSTVTSLLRSHLSQQSEPSLEPSPIPQPNSRPGTPAFTGKPGTYKFLQTEGDATITGVNPALLAAAERLAESLHKPITVASGYRDYQKQAALYSRYVNSGYDRQYIAARPGQSNHNRGNALDLLIDGRPIDSLGAAVLARFGLHNGVPGDHPHTTLLGVNG